MLAEAETEPLKSFTPTLRLPLQTGTSALRDMIFGSLLTLPFLALGVPMASASGRVWLVMVFVVGIFDSRPHPDTCVNRGSPRADIYCVGIEL